MKKQAPDPVFTLRGHNNPVTALKFLSCPGLEYNLISGSSDGALKLWNLSTFRCIKTVESNKHSPVTWIGCSKYQSEVIYMQRKNEFIYSWNMNDNFSNSSQVVKPENEGFCQCEVIEGSACDLLACAGKEKSSVYIFDTSSSSLTHKLRPDDSSSSYGMVMCLKSIQDQSYSYIICGYENGTVALWDLRQMKMLSSISINKDPVMCLDARWASSNLRGVAGSVNQHMASWKSDETNALVLDRTIELRSKGISCAQVRCDNKILCISSWDGTMSIYSWKTLKLLAILDYHSDIVHCTSFSESPIDKYGYMLAAGSKDTQISLWSIY